MLEPLELRRSSCDASPAEVMAASEAWLKSGRRWLEMQQRAVCVLNRSVFPCIHFVGRSLFFGAESQEASKQHLEHTPLCRPWLSLGGFWWIRVELKLSSAGARLAGHGWTAAMSSCMDRRSFLFSRLRVHLMLVSLHALKVAFLQFLSGGFGWFWPSPGSRNPQGLPLTPKTLNPKPS